MKTKQTHYETLGVKPNASPEEIKRNFRQKAAAAHPDKGGDHDAQVELNRAYRTLIDPKRRLLYDATGEDEQRPDEEVVRGLLMQVFSDGLLKDVPHILNHSKDLLKQGKKVLEQQINEATKKRDKLTSKRNKITKKSGENVFTMLVDQQIGQCSQTIAKAEYDLDICVKAEKELKKYKSNEEVPTYGMSDLRLGRQRVSTFGTSTTSGGF